MRGTNFSLLRFLFNNAKEHTMFESFWLIMIATVILTNFILLALASLMHIRNDEPVQDAFMGTTSFRN